MAVEVERRAAEEQIPLRQIEDISRQIATWLRMAFVEFLSSEAPGLMAITDLGEFKAYAIERFKGVLHREVKTSLKINSGIPTWAADRVREAWNISPDY